MANKNSARPSVRAMSDDELAKVLAYASGNAYYRAAREVARRGGLSGRRGAKQGAR